MNKQSAASELILNADGSVYHLHLLPHHIADTIITVGDPDRVPLVSKYFDTIVYKIQKREFITHTGSIGAKKLTVISTGIGTDNIDIVLNELHFLANYDPDKKEMKAEKKQLTFIRIGTSGSVQSDIPVDSFLVSEYAIGLDNLLHFYAYQNTELQKIILEKFKMHCYFYHTIHPYITEADPLLFKQFANGFLKGITLTTPGFYAPQGRMMHAKINMERFYTDIVSFRFAGHRITNIEMETAGLYGLSHVLGHKSISCNALLANRRTGLFSKDPEKTMEKLIEKVIDAICSTP
ncbi:MAG: nucleoside phosphorylase [Chitinophagales bacterium]|nr:nucleoside phosphorylase [Chitinophagales bacterium]